ncbi:MAG: hypothetical protein QW775_07135 [Ignisphaera sp.]|uniref:ABC transporter ATP-binding protein n=1 Tax=Ignisphaera aggregans TaxID=334771 RepID=A0A7C4NUG5_9CREN
MKRNSYLILLPQLEEGASTSCLVFGFSGSLGPTVILMDEPIGALDTDNTKKLMNLIKKLNNKLSQTFIVAIHDILVAKECTNIYALRDGKITDVYRPSEIGRLLQHLV